VVPQAAFPNAVDLTYRRLFAREVNKHRVQSFQAVRLDRSAARIGRRRAAWSALFLMKTYTAKPGEMEREWFLVDADGQTLGRLATRIADTLRGKGKPQYTPHVDTGDFVVVVNAEKIAVTGSKLDSKLYYRHSGYPGGLRQRTLRQQLERRPTEVLRVAVKGMLPKNKLAAAQIRKLKIYAGPEHPHAAQMPKELELS
jgi:large subunit ribosomal protein L13